MSGTPCISTWKAAPTDTFKGYRNLYIKWILKEDEIIKIILFSSLSNIEYKKKSSTILCKKSFTEVKYLWTNLEETN